MHKPWNGRSNLTDAAVAALLAASQRPGTVPPITCATPAAARRLAAAIHHFESWPDDDNRVRAVFTDGRPAGGSRAGGRR